MITLSTGDKQNIRFSNKNFKKNEKRAKKNSAISVDMYMSEIFSVKKAIFLYFSSRKIFLRKNFIYKLIYKFNVTQWTSMRYGKKASQYHETKVVTQLVKTKQQSRPDTWLLLLHCFFAKWGFPPKERHPLSVRIFLLQIIIRKSKEKTGHVCRWQSFERDINQPQY